MVVRAFHFGMVLKTSANAHPVSLDQNANTNLLTLNRVFIDINECIADNGGCHHDCVNTIGTFYCRCWSGFELEENGKHCKDIDECAISNGGCSHRCVNSPGGHRCECPPGMQVNSGGRKCVDFKPLKKKLSIYIRMCDFNGKLEIQLFPPKLLPTTKEHFQSYPSSDHFERL
ncbi:EGF-like domain protein [Teladorsagia circumcincta]|uniref:EGF-like domain protein n=1 Tax=Teladorsagia circumcincta TaxID=45464 RepID=A0A2G9UHI5_TELCI|nr:EGF-like domain protein [Teladorsagia circumcincta]